MKICKNCGTENNDGNAFCTACGGNTFVHRCGKCGTEFTGNFCSNCGTPAGMDMQGDRWTMPSEEPKKKVTFGRVLLWIFFTPIMGIIAIWKAERLKPVWKILLTCLIVAVCLFIILPRNSTREATATVQTTRPPTVTTTDRVSETQPAKAPTSQPTATPKTTATPKPTKKPTPTPTEDPTPKEYKNALASAQMYVDWMHMSKARLYHQLTSPYGEGFSEDAAQYAIDHVKANWKENALKMAQTYSDTMHMSKARIYDQLTSEYGEQFTAEEAQYAVDHVKADWKANALATAKSYRDNLHMSAAAIKNQLTSAYGEKFTAEEAQYAIDHLDD